MKHTATTQQLFDLKALFSNMATPYQRRWFEAGRVHRVRSYTKHRQVGADWFFALEGLIDALETGRNQHYFAGTRRQSLAYSRRYICHFSAQVGIHIAPDANDITFANGATITFNGSRGLFLSGKCGNVYLSEYAWVDHPVALFQVAQGVSMHKRHRLTLYTSVSPNPEGFAVWQRSQSLGFSQVHPLEDSAQHGGMWDAQRIDEIKRECSPEEFRQLYMCEWPQEAAQ